MSQVASNSKIIKNLGLFGSLSPTEAQHALKWGSDPLIVITDLRQGQCQNGIRANGCFVPIRPQEIVIDIGRVKAFEVGGGAGMDNNTKQQLVYIVGTTLLHEMCHWGNFRHNVTEAQEQGKAFEIATYGRDTGFYK